jgi:type IV secretion system protein VirB10
MITNDRYIPAVLETNINSEIPNGPAVAVIENHVYSAEGRNILIPAGSRVRGQYEALNKGNDSRLAVSWVRIIRPDGVGVNIQNSPALDAMGRLGMIGYVDRRYFDRYVVPLLISSFGVGLQYALSEGDVTVTRGSGILGLLGETTTETISRESQAGRALAEALTDTAAQYLQDQVNTTPVIFIPSGTRFLIMPTQDISFRQPTLMTPADEQQSLTQMAQNLISGLQRGEVDQSGLQLAKLLAEAAQTQNGGMAPSGAYDAKGDAALQNVYGPPKTQ